MASPADTPTTSGRVLHRAAQYDVLVWLLTRGRPSAFREKLIELARLETGQSVLDVGCGTGTLAIVAKRRVGRSGAVFGVDPSPQMIVRATAKAAKAGIDVSFRNAVAEALPFPEGHFDVVLSTLMLHHLPRPARQQCAREIHRVLSPGGRVLVVDFSQPQDKHGVLSHFHRHGHVKLQDIEALLDDAKLRPVEIGAVGVSTLHYVLAARPD
jgi:ubiquinone/menaquinone biosynthesis C-methylase UbiE